MNKRFSRSIPKSFLLLLLTGFSLKGLSQGDSNILRLSIPDAQKYALQNNRTVQSSRLDIDLAARKIWENLSLGLPQINLDANYLHQFVVPEISFGQFLNTDLLPEGPLTRDDFVNAYEDLDPIKLGVMDNTTIDLTVSQLVFNGQYFVGLKAARVVQDVSEKALVKTEDLTKESVAASYYALLVLEENLRLLRESKKALDQTYDELVKMNQEGLNEETDVDQMDINRSNVQTLITSLESQRDIAMKVLKYQLGVEFDRRVILTDSLPRIIEQGNLQYLETRQFDLENSIDYQLISTQESISELMVKLEKARSLPTISAFYRHQEQTNQPAFNFAVKDVAGATLNLPIFASGMRSAKVNQAKFELQKMRLSKKDSEQGLIMEFETARNNYRTAYSNYVVNSESMALSKKVYDRTVIKYREGIATSFDLAQNQNQFLTAETNYYNSILALLNAKAKLDRLLRTN